MTLRGLVERVLGNAPAKAQGSRLKRVAEIVEKAMTKQGEKADRDMLVASALVALSRFLCEQLDGLEAEIQANRFSYDGVWAAEKVYPKGSFVTHGGSVWHANYESASRPGDGPAWTLAVKRGRDR